jgi:heptosyltransferase-1
MGAFGDLLHALPAAASLKRTIPGARLTWVVDPKWAWLLEGNPDVDVLLPVNPRSLQTLPQARGALRQIHTAIDVQGLIKSALIARISGASRRYGFATAYLREKIAGIFYTHRVRPQAGHIVDQNLDLAIAAGAQSRVVDFPLPKGKAEGALPHAPFVLACPWAGWAAKQWPLEHYGELAAMLAKESGYRLVLNAAKAFEAPAGVLVHVSGLPGLIHATRNAAAIVGLDSGPLHLAAALGKPGVALFGPTDPARNGPYGSTISVLRDPSAPTTYRRIAETLPCMRALTPRMVFERLLPCLSPNHTPTR